MSITIAGMVAELSANTAAFSRDMGKATKALNSHAARMNKSLAGIESGFKTLGKTIAFIGGTAVIGAFIKHQIELGDQMGKTADKLGLSVEKLSAYDFATRLSGTSSEALRMSLVRLGVNMRDSIINPTSEGAIAFRQLNVEVLDANGQLRQSDSVFEEIAGKLTRMGNRTEAAALATKFLGKTGAELAPLMKNLGALTGEAEAAGYTISDEFARASEMFNDNIERSKQALGALVRTAILPAIQAFNALFEAMDQGTRRELARLEQEYIELQKRMAEEQNIGSFYSDSQFNEDADRMNEVEERIKQLKALIAGQDAGKDEKKKGAFVPEDALSAKKGAANEEDFSLYDRLAKEEQARREALERQIQMMQEGFMTERELETAHYDAKIAALYEANQTIVSIDEEGRQVKMLGDIEFNAMREQLELEHQAKLGDIVAQGILDRRNFEEMNAQQRTQFVLSEMVALTQGVAAQNRVLFNINKVAAIAKLAVDMPAAIGAAIQRGGGLPWGAVFGALTAAKYVALMASARSAKFGSSTSAPSISGGRAIPVTPAEGGGPAQPPPFGPKERPRVFNFHFEGSGVYSAEEIREQMERWAELEGDDGLAINVF